MKPEEKDLPELEQLVRSYIHAVESDETSLESLFADANASLISIATLFDGKDSVQNQFLQQRIRGSYQTIALIPEDIDIRLLNDTTALILFSYHTECIRHDGQPYGIAGLETQVAVKENGRWKLAHVHYSKK